MRGSCSGETDRGARGGRSDVVWSPDGRRLAYLGRGGLYVASANGRDRSRILGRRYSSPAWSPDGRSIVVVGEGALYLVEPDGSGLRRVDGSGSLSEPAWSPDVDHIVAEGPGGSIIALAVNGGRRLRISARGYEPAWSPDGRSVAFQSDGTLMVANSDGTGRVRRLANEKGVASEGGHPVWSPDSRRIAFEVVHDRGRFVRTAMSLSIVDAATDEIARLTYGGSAWDDPAWRDGIVGKSTF